MKEIKEYEKDLASIRTIMERSVKFISLSGLSGVMAGLYALSGATAAYFVVQYPISPFHYRVSSVQDVQIIWKLLIIALIVLVASIATGLWLTHIKAKRHSVTLWNSTSKRLLLRLLIPLATGGIFILIILSTGHFGLAAPASLIFYGLALTQAGDITFDEIRYLGLSEIVLGLLSACMPGYGLIFWALGFGVLHIIYGAILYNKYDK